MTNNEIYSVLNASKTRGFDYRPIDAKKIEPGYTGILQAILVMAREIVNDWNIFFTQKNEPRAFKSIDKNDASLSKCVALSCTSEAKCCLLARNSQPSVVLYVGSKDASLLNQLGYFKSKKIDGYNQFCKDSAVQDFKRLFSEDLSRVKSNCQNDKVLIAKDFMNFTAACGNRTAKQYPLIKSYQ
ncbi:MAG: hypothetical protein ABL927_11090 [Bdellovibrionales bacterium]